jgi:hypothetical protein
MAMGSTAAGATMMRTKCADCQMLGATGNQGGEAKRPGFAKVTLQQWKRLALVGRFWRK